MKKKSGTEIVWFICSVIVVVLPVVLAIIISSIINSKPPQFNDILDSIILVVFSIACSLLSICYQVYKQKKDRLVKSVLCVSVSILAIAWTCYIVSLTKIISKYAKEVFIVSCILIIILSVLGIKLGKKSDTNENQIIKSMHDNCSVIREKLLQQEINKELKTHVIYDNDLLCNPDEFERVKVSMENVLTNKGKGKK